ncbi:ABC transporter permease [Natronoglycomyces albus]|uniref:ABC transporter permease n=1 Tax=Natronoglycomyces albus TaxID=2811108 RepID=A0A895XTW6_9ACTN|nr:ABC transporter permease [Natronoglycomyces albus]QSB05088.1 ABC transporter permease [Natronoglycomyces albus]
MTKALLDAPPEFDKPASTGRLIWNGLTRSPSGFAGGMIVLFIVLLSFVGPFFVDSTLPTDTSKIWNGPSAEHWLGTQYQGKDTFTILILSGAQPIWIGTLAAFTAIFIAVFLGAIAGYFRGSLDNRLLQLTDTVITIPQFLLMLAIVAFFRNLPAVAVALIVGFTTWPVLMRSIRMQVMSLKEREFVEAAKLQQLGAARIIFREILPNMAGFIFVSFILAINNAIYAVVGLYLLGLLPITDYNWGLMIQEAWSQNAYLNSNALPYVLAPLTMIILFQIGLVTLGRSLEQALNPRLRER